MPSNVSVKIDKNKIMNRFFNNDRLKKQIAQIVIDEVEDYVPYLTGATTRSALSYPGYVTYSTLYVRKIYFTPYNFKRWYHAHATDRWVEMGYMERQPIIISRIQAEIDRS